MEIKGVYSYRAPGHGRARNKPLLALRPAPCLSQSNAPHRSHLPALPLLRALFPAGLLATNF